MNIQQSSITNEHASPDITIVRSARNALKDRLAALHDIYLPVLQGKLSVLKSAMNTVEDNLLSALAQGPQVLNTRPVEALLTLIRASDTQTDVPSSGQRSAYVAEINDYLDSWQTGLAAFAKPLSSSLEKMNGFDPGDTQRFVEDMTGQIQRQTTDIDALKLNQAQARADKDALSLAMREYEDKTVFDELIPVVEALKSIDPRSPQASAIFVGVQITVNNLRILSDSVKYSHLVQARKELQKGLDVTSSQINGLQQQVKTFEVRVQMLESVELLGQSRDSYVEEIQKVAAALESFVTSLRESKRDDIIECAQTHMAQAGELAAYLESLRKRWK